MSFCFGIRANLPGVGAGQAMELYYYMQKKMFNNSRYLALPGSIRCPLVVGGGVVSDVP